MKAGTRAFGLAESFVDDASQLAGVVVRADRVVDDFCFGTCTVGGTDVTDTIEDLWGALDRPDVQYLLVAGVALAWYNIVDLDRLHATVERPVLAVTFEPGSDLRSSLIEEFEGKELADRLALYDQLPPRHSVSLGDETVYVRATGLPPDDAADVVRVFTPEGGRPEPLRVARLVARAADSWRRGSEPR